MTQGIKKDQGKRRWSLLPWHAVGAIVDVLTHGAEKYSPDNWVKVPCARERYYDAMLRHITDWNRGEALDQDSKLHHLAHAGCCLLFLLTYEMAREANDPMPGQWDERLP